jgi:hypothetical protein
MENNLIIAKLEVLLGRPFVSTCLGNSNVCFADDGDVRAEYRASFNEKDILAYIIGSTGEEKLLQLASKNVQVSFPKNSSQFWEMVHKKNKHDLIAEVFVTYTTIEFFAAFLGLEKWKV